MDTNFHPTSETTFLFKRGETSLTEVTVSPTLAGKSADTNLIFADPKAPELHLDQAGIVALFKGCLKRLRNGGSIAAPCNLRTLTSLSNALQEAGFKQLRFVQAVSETSEQGFFPESNRTMMLLAVKGGASTFNSIYNNGHYPRPAESNKGAPRLAQDTCPLKYLLSEIVSVHSNPDDLITTTSEVIAVKLQELACEQAIEFRTKPVKPEKKEKILEKPSI